MIKTSKWYKAVFLIILFVFGTGFLFLSLNTMSTGRFNAIADDNAPLEAKIETIESDITIQDWVYNVSVIVRGCNVIFRNVNWTGTYYLRVDGNDPLYSDPTSATLENCNLYTLNNENSTVTIKNSSTNYLQLWDNASVSMEDSRCRYVGTYTDILNPVIFVSNSTLGNFYFDYNDDQDAQITVINSNFTTQGWGTYTTSGLHVGGNTSVYLENCTFDTKAVFKEDSTATIENCSFYPSFYSFLDYDTTATVEINNSRIYDIDIADGNLTIRNSEFMKADFEFTCSLNETRELISYSPNVILSNFVLGDPLPGGASQLAVGTGGRLNISNVRSEIISRLELHVKSGAELYAKNCDIYFTYDFDGVIRASWQNCTFLKTWIRSNNSVFTDCTFYNLIDIDTNPYPFGGSNQPCTIENSKFSDMLIHVLSGGVNIDNCDFVTDIGIVWIDTYIYAYEEKKDCFAFINNSNPNQIKLNLNTELTAENLICDSILMKDTSTGVFDNVTVGTIEVIDTANGTIDNCHISDINFQSPNIQLTNSIVDAMAPTLDVMPSPLMNATDFLLNWTAQPGQNITGNMASYRVFRADKPIGSGAPSPSEYGLIHTIMNPNPTNPADTHYNDTNLILPSSLDGRHLYYMVELKDEGNNAGNSTVLSTVYDTTITLGALDAQVYFNDLLTTYDEINVSVFMVDSDINENGTHDCGEAKLYCKVLWNNGTNSSQEYSSLGTSINGVVYYFTIPQSYNATDIYFSAVVHQSSSFDSYGVGVFDFNSTIKYGSPFHVFAPTIAFTPVSHPSEHNILESEAINISVNVLKNAQYISHVQIYYRSDGQSWTMANLTYDSGKAEFSITLPNFDVGVLEYYITYNDLGNQQYNLLRSAGDPETKNIIPSFPIKQLEIDDLLIIFLGSVLVGAVLSLVYISINSRLNKREQLKRKQKLRAILSVSGKSVKTIPAKNEEGR